MGTMSKVTTGLRAWRQARNDKARDKALSGVPGMGPQHLRDRPPVESSRMGNNIGSIGWGPK